jgi:hypothetical protein
LFFGYSCATIVLSKEGYNVMIKRETYVSRIRPFIGNDLGFSLKQSNVNSVYILPYNKEFGKGV